MDHLSYADDMVILRPSATIYNVKKSMCMAINSAKYRITNLPLICLAGVLLEYVERYKYLGMIIHVRNDDYDITNNSDL